MKRVVAIVFILVQWMAHSTIYAQIPPACDCLLTIDNTFQIVPMTQGPNPGSPPLYENDDAASPAIALPFHFCFYGQSFDSVYISNNGIVSFKKPIYTFDTISRFPSGGDSMIIAPFYADVNTLFNGGEVYYSVTPTHLAVIWDSVRYVGIDVDGWDAFQLIITDGTDPLLPPGNNISFCYPIMQWSCSDSSGGFSGYGGTPAEIGINKGDKVAFALINSISKPGNLYYGPFSPDNGIDWMDSKSFTLNSCVNTTSIAPVIYNYGPNCSTLYVCPCDTTDTEHALGAPDSLLTQPCDTVTLTGAFICAVPGQSATLSYSCDGPLNIYSVDTSTMNGIDSITVQVIPAFGDTGSQVLTLTATDPVSHLQSSVTYNIVVTVNCRDSTPPAPVAIITPTPNTNFSVYPNPANKNVTINLNNNQGITTAGFYDILGKEIFSVKLTNKVSDIDVSGLSNGMYFIKLLRKGIAVSIKKIIIQ